MHLGLGNNFVKQGNTYTRFPTILTLNLSEIQTALTINIDGVDTALILNL